MARFQNKRGKLYLILSLLGLILILSGGLAFVAIQRLDEFANLSAFPVDSYLEGRDLWSHEDFRIEGRVDNVILRSLSGTTLLLSLHPKGSTVRLPILLQTGDGKIPIKREQNLIMKVKLGNASQIQCQSYAPR